jgi:hypothetical protein
MRAGMRCAHPEEENNNAIKLSAAGTRIDDQR